MTLISRLMAVPALVAAVGLGMPAQAASYGDALPQASQGRDLSILSASGADWDRGRRYYRHRRGADAGDIIAGVLVLGGALAVANAIKNRKEDARESYPQRYPDYDDRDYDNRYRSYPQPQGYSRGGIEGAIGQCVDEVERDTRVGNVDEAQRDGNGWTVSGDLLDGGRFRCEIDGAGRIRDLDIEAGRADWGAAPSGADYAPGYDEDYYAGARARQGMSGPQERAYEIESTGEAWSDEAQAYREPQAELPEGEQEWERGDSDDRYDTSEGPVVALAS